jgi:protein gp37
MGDNSKVEWTDATWNPVAGCSKVSPGCKNCYAMREAHRLAANPNPKIAARYRSLTHIVNAHPEWTGDLRLNLDTLDVPLRWRRPRRIFVNSLSDLFHEALPDDAINRVFFIMLSARQHEYQILTKRENRLLSYIRRQPGPGWLEILNPNRWPPRHIRLGVSIEDQRRADERFPAVCELGELGWNTMVSLEPLLGPVRIPERYLALGSRAWVIAGGESGPGARPPHPDWFRSIRDQCIWRVNVEAPVPFLFKQWGNWAPTVELPIPGRHTGGDLFVLPTGRLGCQGNWWDGKAAAMDNVGKKAAGALLDGREWREFPELRR